MTRQPLEPLVSIAPLAPLIVAAIAVLLFIASIGMFQAQPGEWSVIMIADGESWAIDTGLTQSDCNSALADWRNPRAHNVTFICERES